MMPVQDMHLAQCWSLTVPDLLVERYQSEKHKQESDQVWETAVTLEG